MVNTAIERQQELKRMLLGYGGLRLLSCDDNITTGRVSKRQHPGSRRFGAVYTSTGFGSTILAQTMEISYSAISGSARPVWVMMSGGARMAATTNMPTQA